MAQFLTDDEIKTYEAQSGLELFHVRNRHLGSILFSLPAEADYRSFKRAQNEAVMKRSGDMHAAQKNLVASCLQHPTPAAFFAAVEKSRRFGVIAAIAVKIDSLCGETEEEAGKE